MLGHMELNSVKISLENARKSILAFKIKLNKKTTSTSLRHLSLHYWRRRARTTAAYVVNDRNIPIAGIGWYC
jgi:hypothetical protein